MKNLRNGILLEDAGSFLKWGKSMKSITKKVSCEIKSKGDRTVYNWGKHKVLNGLELDLQSTFWNFEKDRWFRSLKKVEHWTIGDLEAKAQFELISNHLTSQFGPAKTEKSSSDESSLIWIAEGIKLDLYLFEQHCYKLHFTISRK